MASRTRRNLPRVIDVGQYQVTRRGDSKGVNCFKKLDKYDFPSHVGAGMDVLYREEGPDGEPEVVLKPATDGE